MASAPHGRRLDHRPASARCRNRAGSSRAGSSRRNARCDLVAAGGGNRLGLIHNQPCRLGLDYPALDELCGRLTDRLGRERAGHGRCRQPSPVRLLPFCVSIVGSGAVAHKTGCLLATRQSHTGCSSIQMPYAQESPALSAGVMANLLTRRQGVR